MSITSHLDIAFASTPECELSLDLHLPDGVADAPLVMYIHGGGWRNGTRKRCPLDWLPAQGYALASVDYRLSDQAVFPAQIHDCKAALRWLRAHADDYGYDASRVVVSGSSAGGHLALLMGLTAGHPELDGAVGLHGDQSTAVHAVIDYFGPSDFILRAQSHPARTLPPDSPVFRLLGGSVLEHPELARLASPAFHVDADSPPLLVYQGDADVTVYPDQSERIVALYREHGLDVTYIIVPGAAHGGPAYHDETNRPRTLDFLARVYR